MKSFSFEGITKFLGIGVTKGGHRILDHDLMLIGAGWNLLASLRSVLHSSRSRKWDLFTSSCKTRCGECFRDLEENSVRDEKEVDNLISPSTLSGDCELTQKKKSNHLPMSLPKRFSHAPPGTAS